MKIAIVSLLAFGGAVTGAVALTSDGEAVPPPVEQQQATQSVTDANLLFELVKQARADLREARVSAGLGARPAQPQVSRRESREGNEGGDYISKMTRQNRLFDNGARLVLQFNPATQVFAGSVTNTTGSTLSQVRVEIHLDNGTELGPAKRIDLRPGQTIPVELGAFGNAFSSWVSHPEAGVEQGHGSGGEEGGEGRGEGREGRGERGGEGHGAGAEAAQQGAASEGMAGARPGNLMYRPLYNQLQILRGEMQAFEAELTARSR
ncbi:MAG: hypothetical protein OXU74_17575 [Gemmatimonadota bacterium]|nr:hypothetical protein [Gemmatimonadota bacterium]